MSIMPASNLAQEEFGVAVAVVVAKLLPDNVFAIGSAMKTAINAWANEDKGYFACLGSKPSSVKHYACEVAFLAEVVATGAKLVGATGTQIAESVFKSIGIVLTTVNIVKFAYERVSQYATLTKEVDRTLSISSAA